MKTCSVGRKAMLARSERPSAFILGTWAYLAIVFLVGGGSRGDIAGLIVLRPLAILVCGYAVWRMRPGTLSAHWRPIAFLGVTAFVVLLHLIPLPPALWTMLPGRDIIVDVDQATGVGDVWRPLTMTPSEGQNAFFSLFVPTAMLLLTILLSKKEKSTLLPFFISAAIISGLMGVLQILAGSESVFNLYALKDGSGATGLFTNRNHAGIFLACLSPMLAVWAAGSEVGVEQLKFRCILAFVVSLTTIPLILMTGSRIGLLLGFLGLLSAVLLFQTTGAGGRGKLSLSKRAWLIVVAAAVAVATLTAIFAHALALDRLFAGEGNEIRFRMWGPLIGISNGYLPFGSGVGSFERVYQVFEPHNQLRTTYANHAHNDWLEVYLTMGLPGLMLLVAALYGWAKLSLSVWRPAPSKGREALMGRLASVIILILGIASISDYPLRVPSLACLAAVAVAWLYEDAHGQVAYRRGA